MLVRRKTTRPREQNSCISNYVAKWKTIDAEPWYFGKIKCDEAEKELLSVQNEHGAFLIRVSESPRNQYSLSVRYGDTYGHHLGRDPRAQSPPIFRG